MCLCTSTHTQTCPTTLVLLLRCSCTLHTYPTLGHSLLCLLLCLGEPLHVSEGKKLSEHMPFIHSFTHGPKEHMVLWDVTIVIVIMKVIGNF